MLATLASCSVSSDKPSVKAVPVANKPAIGAGDERLERDCTPKPSDIVVRLGDDSKAFSARIAGWYVDCWNRHHQYVAAQRKQRQELTGGSGHGGG